MKEINKKLDRIIVKIVGIDSEIKAIHEDKVTKNEFRGLVTTVDEIATNVKKLNDERVITNNRISRPETKVNAKE